MAKILFVDDDATMRNAMRLSLADHEVITKANRQEALNALRDISFDLLLTDLFMPDKKDGLALVAEAKRMDEDLFVVVVTGFAAIDTAVEAIKAGADDYISKEFSPEGLRLSVGRFLEERHNRRRLRRLEAENRMLQREVLRPRTLIGESPVMVDMRRKIDLAARDGETTVLILGESGTGKELVAHDIHALGPRRAGPFIPIDCPAIPRDLFETELFGHEKGAFTDAKSRKLGRVELAHEGTLFLDEIADLPLPMQAKLLRFLEAGSFYRVGGTQPVAVDVRVLAATNRDLQDLVVRDKFREDLFYRLQVVVIEVPRLAERGADILLLAEHFLQEFNARKGGRAVLEEVERESLLARPWPGNVRELRNAMESHAVLGRLPEPRGGKPFGDTSFKVAKRKVVAEFESRYLRDALARNGGNVTRTAEEIGLAREELSRKLKKAGIS